MRWFRRKVAALHAVRKTQTARVSPPHPPTPSPPLGGEGELRIYGESAPSMTQKGSGFLRVFASLREPSARTSHPATG